MKFFIPSSFLFILCQLLLLRFKKIRKRLLYPLEFKHFYRPELLSSLPFSTCKKCLHFSILKLIFHIMIFRLTEREFTRYTGCMHKITFYYEHFIIWLKSHGSHLFFTRCWTEERRK